MKVAEARQIGQHVASFLKTGKLAKANQIMLPVLEQKIPYRQLDCIAEQLTDVPDAALQVFLDELAHGASLGAWVIIATSLRLSIPQRSHWALRQSHAYITLADVWYACDSIAERVHGPALVQDFDRALKELTSWRVDANRWVRRAIGVGMHVWAKRAKGDPILHGQATQLLNFVQPLFTEQDYFAVKGIGWGLKTIGRYYPQVLVPWLEDQLPQGGFRLTMLSKALTYLPKVEQIALRSIVQ